jgi:hypothetical protein
MAKYIILILIIFNCTAFAEETKYEANYEPLNCKGIAFDSNEMFLSEWQFKSTGGSGSLITILYNKKKRTGKIRTSVYENGDLYGRGKWIGRTSSRIYNTLVEINYEKSTRKFELISLFNPDNFHMNGKCDN